MEHEDIKAIYLKAVKTFAAGGRVTASGRVFINEINQIFEATDLDEIGFQEAVYTIGVGREGEDVDEETIKAITASLRSFLKTEGSPFKTFKDGRKLMIGKKD